jgi:hypothetical protein
MIYTDSRYVDGKLFTAYNKNKQDYDVTVLRVFPSDSTDFFLYTWQENDRIDLVAQKFLSTSTPWYKIMDRNPEIINPFNIPVGTVIRIPNVG